LANGQVDELLVSGALEETHPLPEEVRAILAPELPDSGGGTASEEPRQASLPDLLVTKARQSGATVTIIEDRGLARIGRRCGRVPCDGAGKVAIGLLIEKYVQNH